jgi:diketogulonate reductase-like aldo/keto reductase
LEALVEAVEAGKVKSIGVSNYGVHHLDELEEWIKETESKEGKGKGGVLSVNQVELHPWLARPDIVKWCEQRGVILEVRYVSPSHCECWLITQGLLSYCTRPAHG